MLRVPFSENRIKSGRPYKIAVTIPKDHSRLQFTCYVLRQQPASEQPVTSNDDFASERCPAGRQPRWDHPGLRLIAHNDWL
jgi:hypothetical protein